MEPYLPPETVDRPGYKQCRTTYGLLTTTYKRIEASNAPEKVYKELQQLEIDLRRRLQNLNAAKGIPVKMMQFLNELKAALEHALAEGVDADFLIQGITDLLEEKPESLPAPKPERVRMIPDTKYKKVKAELVEANKKIQKLNEENNSLALYIKRLEADRRRH
jgi:DNA-binding transcriptional MerR regulator